MIVCSGPAAGGMPLAAARSALAGAAGTGTAGLPGMTFTSPQLGHLILVPALSSGTSKGFSQLSHLIVIMASRYQSWVGVRVRVSLAFPAGRFQGRSTLGCMRIVLRSEERRVGKEGRSRWAPYPQKNE